MSIVKTNIPMTAQRNEDTILALVKEYPFLRTEVLTESAYGRNIRTLVIGNALLFYRELDLRNLGSSN